MGQVTMADQQSHVTVGVDSHKDVHVAAVIDQVGQILATTSVATTDRGPASSCAGRSAMGRSTAWAWRARAASRLD
jgi:transposase